MPPWAIPVIKYALLAAAVLGIYLYILDSGKKIERVETLETIIKVERAQNEKELQVQSTVNRVVSDPVYRQRVRDRYDAVPRD